MVVSGNGIEWRSPNHWTKLIWLYWKSPTVYDFSLETDRHPPSIHLVGDKWLIKWFFIKQSETLRDVSILRRWKLNFNGRRKARLSSYQLWKKQSSTEFYHSAKSADCGGLCWFSPDGVRVCRERIFELIGIVADDAYLQWPVSKFELASLFQSAIGDLPFWQAAYGRIG